MLITMSCILVFEFSNVLSCISKSEFPCTYGELFGERPMLARPPSKMHIVVTCQALSNYPIAPAHNLYIHLFNCQEN